MDLEFHTCVSQLKVCTTYFDFSIATVALSMSSRTTNRTMNTIASVIRYFKSIISLIFFFFTIYCIRCNQFIIPSCNTLHIKIAKKSLAGFFFFLQKIYTFERANQINRKSLNTLTLSYEARKEKFYLKDVMKGKDSRILFGLI